MKLTDVMKEEKTTDWLSGNLSENEIAKIKELALVSAKIELKRAELGMNQKEFAKYMGVSQSMVSKWESGTYNFTLATLYDICEKLDMEFEVHIRNREYYAEDNYKLIKFSPFKQLDTNWNIKEDMQKGMEIAS